jgi:16S rRNA (cytosine967-C5)-methyltransferase
MLPEGTKMREDASASPARLAAFDVLRRVEEESAFASVLLAAKEEVLRPNDRSLCHELVLGVLRRQLWLDYLIAHYANRAVERLDLPVRLALRLGLYQLRFLSRVPARAAVNESVNLVRRARLRSAESFVNAVLRRATREPEYDPVTSIADPIEKVAVETSHPSWLIERWIKALGADEARAFARANNEAPPVAFRVVHQRASEAEILEALRSAGASLSSSQIAPGAWRITGAGDLLREFARSARIYIQDEASQLAARVVDVRLGDRVLDVCAAPGSKTTQLSDLAGNRALVVAGDLHEHRLRTLKKISASYGHERICCVIFDGLRDLPFHDSTFDRVLVDAPCTGTGTLRRNPEIRWRISNGDIEDLSARQSCILRNASRMVKAGGRLVYSTCSMEPEENEQVAAKFIEQTDDFRRVALPVGASLITASGAARTWPHRHGADGFFIVAFERRN